MHKIDKVVCFKMEFLCNDNNSNFLYKTQQWVIVLIVITNRMAESRNKEITCRRVCLGARQQWSNISAARISNKVRKVSGGAASLPPRCISLFLFFHFRMAYACSSSRLHQRSHESFTQTLALYFFPQLQSLADNKRAELLLTQVALWRKKTRQFGRICIKYRTKNKFFADCHRLVGGISICGSPLALLHLLIWWTLFWHRIPLKLFVAKRRNNGGFLANLNFIWNMIEYKFVISIQLMIMIASVLFQLKNTSPALISCLLVAFYHSQFLSLLWMWDVM